MVKGERYVSLTEARRHLLALVRRAEVGEETVIARDRTPVARIVPLAATNTQAKGLGASIGEIMDRHGGGVDLPETPREPMRELPRVHKP